MIFQTYQKILDLYTKIYSNCMKTILTLILYITAYKPKVQFSITNLPKIASICISRIRKKNSLKFKHVANSCKINLIKIIGRSL